MKPWLLAIRPKTLVAAVIPVLVGTALAVAVGYKVSWHLSLHALISVCFIQIATNLFNDALDFKKGADTAQRLGPVRVTQNGLLSFQQVFVSGFVCLLIATLFGIPLVMAGGWVIAAIGLVSLLFAYLYTGGPTPLAYIGGAEIFVLLFFGLIAVGGVFYLHTAQLTVSALIAGFQVGCLSTVLLAINNLRDLQADQKANKKTFAVRFGIPFARMEIALFILIPFLLNFHWWSLGYRWAATLPLVSIPFALQVIRGVYRTEPSSLYNYFLGRAALLHLNFGGLLAVGLLWR